MRKAINFLCWFPAIAWMWVIYHYSIVPQSDKPKLIQDKLQHIIIYFVLTFLVYFAIRYTAQLRFRISASIVFHFCIIYAAVIQMNQERPSVPRNGEFDDWFADVAGAALVFIFLLALKKLGSKGKAIYSLLSNGSDD